MDSRDPRAHRFARGRHAGVLVPLFSVASEGAWGIGEIGDLPALGTWLRYAGFDFVQILPVNELSHGQTSPYSAFTAMAIDPVYISLGRLAEFQELGGEEAMASGMRRRLARVRHKAVVDYHEVRHLKWTALWASFERFDTANRRGGGGHHRTFDEFVSGESWWLDDYVLYRALHARYEGRPWMEWPEALRAREAGALAGVRRELERELRFFQYLQWAADEQWRSARDELEEVGLFGDFPFMVGDDSADVWSRPHDFRLDVSVGAPPDAFSEEGQDWGLPAYRWDVMAREGYAWLRDRARRSAALYDGLRVDHVVGFYRTYYKPRDGTAPAFTPADESEQLALGEHLMRLFQAAGPRIIAEDLGTVPDFVRASLARLSIPGYRVLRWEREWNDPQQPFRDPLRYPPVSVATTGTHDTDTLAIWWTEAPIEERELLMAIPSLRSAEADLTSTALTPHLRDAFLDLLFRSGSDLLILPLQDIFGWPDRINLPGTDTATNWTWRLPWAVDRLLDEVVPRERAETMRGMAEVSGRAAGLRI